MTLPSPLSNPTFNGVTLSSLPPVSPDEVSKLLSPTLPKSSSMDVIPTSLLKTCSGVSLNHCKPCKSFFHWMLLSIILYDCPYIKSQVAILISHHTIVQSQIWTIFQTPRASFSISNSASRLHLFSFQPISIRLDVTTQLKPLFSLPLTKYLTP